MYDRTAQEALSDLRHFADEHDLPRPLFDSHRNSRICVGVGSARRPGSPFKYLTQTLASLVTRMGAEDGVYIHVFNLDDEPELHTEVADIRDLFGVSNIKAKAAVRLERKLQEGLDFADTLTEMHSWGCPSVLLLEDDALAQDNWVEMVELAVAGASQSWFATRLFVSNSQVSRTMQPSVTDLDQGFNTVAVLFNSEKLPAFTAAIRRAVDDNHTTGNKRFFEAKDVFMSRYGRATNVRVQTFQPPIFQHTGIFSSVVKRSAYRVGAYMQAPNFASEGLPIRFNPDLWS